MNNRELKFRAWDNLKKEWLKRKVYHFNPHFNEEGIGEFRLSQHAEGFTIQQYTGLKDKNGIEIYEGDILERIQSPGESRNYYKVIWHNYMWIAVCTRKNYSHCLDQFNETKYCKIVGNIFENPKLLEK